MSMNIDEFVILPIALGVTICTEVIKRVAFKDDAIRDRFVPLIAILLGVLFNAWYNNWQFDYIIFLNGLASGFAGIGAFATFKSMSKKVEKDG